MAKRYTKEWRQNISNSRKGKIAWNKGLTKDDERVAKYANKIKGRIFTEEHKKKLRKAFASRTTSWNKGKHWSETIKKKISDAKKGKRQENSCNEHHYRWKGNKVGYKALHGWLRRNYGIPTKCERCNATKSIEWSNISGEYKRDREDWEHLCTLCHRRKDGNQYTKKL